MLLGSILGAQIVPTWAKLRPRRLSERFFLNNMNVHETSAGVVFGAFPGPQESTQNDPRSAQDGPKPILKSDLFDVEFRLQFWVVLGPILGVIWDPFGVLFGSARRPCWGLLHLK